MTDYYTSIGSKSSINGSGVFSTEGIKHELLLDYYKEHNQLSESNRATILQMFRRWCLLLSTGFNIVAYGPQSKFSVLETFSAQYLKSGHIKRYQMNELVIVRMHGFTPITLEKFTHALFGKVDSSKLVEEDLDTFLYKAKKIQTHYIFLLHSFELLHRECKKIIDLIFKLYVKNPNLIHIIMSVDHINHGKILTNTLMQRLRLNFFLLPNVGSFFHEKTQSVEVMNDVKDSIAMQTHKIFEGQLNLQSLKDVYQAIQPNNQQLMLHIIKHFYDRTLSSSQNEQSQGERRSTRFKGAGYNSTVYSFDQLFNWSMNAFIVRRRNTLENYLEELVDHNIVSIDNSRSKVQCLADFETCKKFLTYVGAL